MSNKKYLIKRQCKDKRDIKVAFSILPKSISKFVDLRVNEPEIFDQLTLNSCSANAGVANMMMLESKIKNLSISDIPLLSRLFLYYHERVIENTVNEDSGANMRDICKALNKYGVCEEKYFPYNISDFATTPSINSLANALNHKIKSYQALPTLGYIKKYIDNNHLPVLIGIDIFESFESDEVTSSGIVSMPKKGEKNLGGHAVLVVGYDDNFITPKHPSNFIMWIIQKLFKSKSSKGALIVRNSWGKDWGDNGHFYLPYEFITKKFAFDFWSIIA